jgi:hypothetical protein
MSEQTIPKPQYKIAFFTPDSKLYTESYKIRQQGYTHEYLYRKGIDAVKSELGDKSQ